MRNPNLYQFTTFGSGAHVNKQIEKLLKQKFFN